MNRLCLLVVLGLPLVFSASSFAKEGKGGDRDDVKRHQQDGDRDHDRDGRLRHRHHDRDDRRLLVSRHNSSRPPGWNHGKKTGWDDCDLPPGQAKKSGCNTIHHRQHKRVVWARRDRDRDRERDHDRERH